MDMRQQRMNIELGEKEAEGIYSNMVMVAHSPNEIILDFARIMPGAQKAKVQSRIIMTPAHEENLKKFEKQFGEIKIHGGPDSMLAKNIGFESAGPEEEKEDKKK